MEFILIVKIILMSFVWTIGWTWRFAIKNTEVNVKSIGVAYAPWILMLLYFLLFWWG